MLSAYVEDRYETGIVGVFAVPLPRIVVPVKEETLKMAEEEAATIESGGAIESVEVSDATMEDQRAPTDEGIEGQNTEENSASAPAPVRSEEDSETKGETKIVIHIVANRYKLSNFW